MSWQEVLRQRLVDRNAKELAYAGVIEQYRRLANEARLLKSRNAALLKAVGSVRSNPNASTVLVGAEDNPVRAAYTSSLESQITSLRDEMAAVYKTQGQNAQRLLAMNETLREKEDQSRIEAEKLRVATEELTVLRRKVEQHNEQLVEKDRAFQNVVDEVGLLQLELSQKEQRIEDLTRDNARMIQEWIDKTNEAANKFNEANAFYEDMVTKFSGRPSEDSSVSGNGERRLDGKFPSSSHGLAGDPSLGLHLSPNG